MEWSFTDFLHGEKEWPNVGLFHPTFSPDSACKQDSNLLADGGRRKQKLTGFFVNATLSLFSHYVANPVKLFYILNISLTKFPIHVMLEIK